MTKREMNKLMMYKSVNGLLKEKTSITTTVPAFATVAQQFQAAIDAIETKHKEHKSVAKGRAQQKGANEDELVDSLVTVCSILYVLAVQTGDKALQEAVRVNESMLKRLRDVDLLNRANTIYSYANNKAAELANYGLDAASLTSLGEKIKTFGGALENTEVGAAEKTAARHTLSEGIDHADHVLYDMLDPLMEIFRSSQVEFYNQYMSARVIKDL
ncbi:MAG: hypothetical protein ACOY90_09060 [Candidatus Zhuqueibacterota bacterium]